MASFTGIIKTLQDLTAQTTAEDTDLIPIGTSVLKKITFANLRKALGVDALNSNSNEVKTLLNLAETANGSTHTLSENYKNFRKVAIRLSFSNAGSLSDIVEIPTDVSTAVGNQILKKLEISSSEYAYIQCGFTGNTTLTISYLFIAGSRKVYASVYGIGRK